MVLVGLIGQTGAGKSEVCRLLEGHNIYIIDGDRLAREVTAPGSPVLAALAAAFGGDILRADGSLDRALLASRAFADADSLARLNAVTHPAITKRTLRLLEEARAKGYRAAVFEGAALLESPLRAYCNFFAAVTAPAELRLSRILARDGIEKAAAESRMAAQREEAYYCAPARVIIRSYPPYDLEMETQGLLKEITKTIEAKEEIN